VPSPLPPPLDLFVVEKLVAAGILEPISDSRNKIYMARRIVELIEAP